MSMIGYLVAKRTELTLAGAWGLWSEERRRWLDVTFTTESDAAEVLGILIAEERRCASSTPEGCW